MAVLSPRSKRQSGRVDFDISAHVEFDATSGFQSTRDMDIPLIWSAQRSPEVEEVFIREVSMDEFVQAERVLERLWAPLDIDVTCVYVNPSKEK